MHVRATSLEYSPGLCNTYNSNSIRPYLPTKSHPTNRPRAILFGCGGFPRNGIAMGISHASWAMGKFGIVSSSLFLPRDGTAWADQPYNPYERTPPSTTPPFRVPAHSPTLPTRPAAKADIPHPCRSDQNLLFFPALLDSSGTYVKKAKNA